MQLVSQILTNYSIFIYLVSQLMQQQGQIITLLSSLVGSQQPSTPSTSSPNPSQSSTSYMPPNPSQSSTLYIQSQPSTSYMPSNQSQPSTSYMPPNQSQPSTSYIPSNQSQPSTSYIPSNQSQPSTSYMPSNSNLPSHQQTRQSTQQSDSEMLDEVIAALTDSEPEHFWAPHFSSGSEIFMSPPASKPAGHASCSDIEMITSPSPPPLPPPLPNWSQYNSTVSTSANKVIPPPPFQTPPKLKSVEEVLQNYRGQDVHNLRNLSMALAREAIFGREDMSKRSLSGRHSTQQLSQTKLDYTKSLVRARAANKSDSDFEPIWALCRNSISKFCQTLRNSVKKKSLNF